MLEHLHVRVLLNCLLLMQIKLVLNGKKKKSLFWWIKNNVDSGLVWISESSSWDQTDWAPRGDSPSLGQTSQTPAVPCVSHHVEPEPLTNPRICFVPVSPSPVPCPPLGMQQQRFLMRNSEPPDNFWNFFAWWVVFSCKYVRVGFIFCRGFVLF